MIPLDVRAASAKAHEPPPVYLREHGERVDPTSGDVDALLAGAARVLGGEAIEATSHGGLAVRVYLDRAGDARTEIDGHAIYVGNAYDALVVAYGAISCWQVAWSAFEGARAPEPAPAEEASP